MRSKHHQCICTAGDQTGNSDQASTVGNMLREHKIPKNNVEADIIEGAAKVKKRQHCKQTLSYTIMDIIYDLNQRRSTTMTRLEPEKRIN